MARRSAPLALVAIGLALGSASVAIGRAHPGWWFAGESIAASALELVAGLALIAAGAVSWQRRPTSAFGPLLAAAGLAWFAPELNAPAIGSALGFTAGLILAAACPPLVAHAALAYPNGRLRSSAERLALGLGYVASVGLVGILPALLFDPAAEGCAQCPRNLLLVHWDASLGEDLRTLGLQLGPFWAAVLLVLGVLRVARGSEAERRLVLPVLVPAAAYLAATAWLFQRGADRGFLGIDSLDLSLWTAQGAALCLLAGGVSWEWIRRRRTRSALAALVVDLERSSGPGGLGAALARRLGDSGFELLHERPSGELVDAAGHRRAPGPGQQLTPLVSRGRTLAVAVHRPGLFDHTSVTEELASAARLALDNERLQAELHAQLEDLRASRARIVEASDTERRRLERDLHDGAQQRLVTLSLSLGLTLAEGNGNYPALERAQHEVKRLLGELRELAHGIYPVALAEEGLASAVAALREQSGVAIRLHMPSPEDRFDARIEHTAYVIIREMVRDDCRSGASIDMARDGSRFVVEIVRDGAMPAELVLLEDRVGAVGRSAPLGGTGARRHPSARGVAMRIAIADDEVLLREGLARLLAEAGVEVVATAGDPKELIRRVELTRPDVAIVDIKMPPTHTDEGLVAAQELRERHPELGVLVLSHYLDSRYAMRLLEDLPNGAGYLLKERVSDVAVLVDALRRVHEGECVVDPTIVSRLMSQRQDSGPLAELTPREREVLALMAEGHSNGAICERLFLSPKTVETHVRQIFLKLGLRESPAQHRRVSAVLAFLRNPAQG